MWPGKATCVRDRTWHATARGAQPPLLPPPGFSPPPLPSFFFLFSSPPSLSSHTVTPSRRRPPPVFSLFLSLSASFIAVAAVVALLHRLPPLLSCSLFLPVAFAIDRLPPSSLSPHRRWPLPSSLTTTDHHLFPILPRDRCHVFLCFLQLRSYSASTASSRRRPHFSTPGSPSLLPSSPPQLSIGGLFLSIATGRRCQDHPVERHHRCLRSPFFLSLFIFSFVSASVLPLRPPKPYHHRSLVPLPQPPSPALPPLYLPSLCSLSTSPSTPGEAISVFVHHHGPLHCEHRFLPPRPHQSSCRHLRLSTSSPSSASIAEHCRELPLPASPPSPFPPASATVNSLPPPPLRFGLVG